MPTIDQWKDKENVKVTVSDEGGGLVEVSVDGYAWASPEGIRFTLWHPEVARFVLSLLSAAFGAIPERDVADKLKLEPDMIGLRDPYSDHAWPIYRLLASAALAWSMIRSRQDAVDAAGGVETAGMPACERNGECDPEEPLLAMCPACMQSAWDRIARKLGLDVPVAVPVSGDWTITQMHSARFDAEVWLADDVPDGGEETPYAATVDGRRLPEWFSDFDTAVAAAEETSKAQGVAI